MLVLLPPSETKVEGGIPGSRLQLKTLSFPSQLQVRGSLLEQLGELSRDEEKSLRNLKLGPKGRAEVLRNRQVESSPVMPAIERYTGVLFDALGYGALGVGEKDWVVRNTGVFSALFGLVRSGDLIPAYRLSHDSRLAGGSLAAQWAVCAPSLWEETSDFLLDVRSEGYRRLAPIPEGSGVFVAVVREGSRKALGHANKATKGRLVRELAQSRADFSSTQEFLAWSKDHGWRCEKSSQGEGIIDLVISDT